MDEFTVDENGLLSEIHTRSVAQWYSNFGKGDVETFEAAISLLRATSTMTSIPDGPTRNLGRTRYSFLRAIYQADQHRMQLSELGETLDVSPTHVSKIIDSLSDEGLATRIRDTQDKRRTRVALTEAGKAAVEEVLPEMIESTVHTWRLFSTEEKRYLAHLANKLRLSILMDKSAQLGGRFVTPLPAVVAKKEAS
jgi:DNA-binding MarR family transcriptional regulator